MTSFEETVADAVHTAVAQAAERHLIPLIERTLAEGPPERLVYNSTEAAHALNTGLDGLRDHETRGLRIMPGTQHRKLYRVAEIERHLEAVAPVEPAALRSVS